MNISGTLKTGFQNGIAALVKAVFPAKCLGCGALFHPNHPFPELKLDKKDLGTTGYEESFQREMAPYLCPTCMTGFVPIDSPICSRCGMMFVSREGEDHLCHTCITQNRVFTKARSLGVYDQTLMTIIHAFKYGGKIQLAGPLSMILLNVLLSHWRADEIDLVVPVPLHPKRFRSRGFNQACLPVRKWPELLRQRGQKEWKIQIVPDALIRKIWTRPQTGLNKKERRQNIKNAFHLQNEDAIREKRVLLVDDVFTTGATVHECAKILKKGGAKTIDVLTLARA